MDRFLKLRKTVGVFIYLMAIFSSLEKFAPAQNLLPPSQESEAYKRYVRGPKSELAKLLYLIDRFWNTNFKVIYDGVTYDANFVVVEARVFLFENYKHEKAEDWVKTHTYHSEPGGAIIYLKYPDGKTRPARDVLLEELSALNNLNPSEEQKR